MDPLREPPVQRRGARRDVGARGRALRRTRRGAGAARGRRAVDRRARRRALRTGERPRGVSRDGRAGAARAAVGVLAAPAGGVGRRAAGPARRAAGRRRARTALARRGRRVRGTPQDDPERRRPAGRGPRARGRPPHGARASTRAPAPSSSPWPSSRGSPRPCRDRVAAVGVPGRPGEAERVPPRPGGARGRLPRAGEPGAPAVARRSRDGHGSRQARRGGRRSGRPVRRGSTRVA